VSPFNTPNNRYLKTTGMISMVVMPINAGQKWTINKEILTRDLVSLFQNIAWKVKFNHKNIIYSYHGNKFNTKLG